MSDTNKKDSMETNHIDKLYQDEYIRHIHKIGTVTMMALLVISFLPAIYVSFVKGMHPGWGVIGKAAVTLLGINVFQWIIEPLILDLWRAILLRCGFRQLLRRRMPLMRNKGQKKANLQV